MPSQNISSYAGRTGLGSVRLPSGSSFSGSNFDRSLVGDFKNASFGTSDNVPVSQPFSPQPSGTQSWNFIVAPSEIAWGSNAEVNVQKIFGTNTPPVVVGTKGMRELKLGDALVEGFSRGVTVEGKIAALEALMNFTLNNSAGFVNVPVYQVKANSKLYGGSDGGFFVMKEIGVKEMIRDLSGNTTRAKVDISFTQVPAYQVDSGLDQASQPVLGSKAAFPDPNQNVNTANSSGPSAPKPK